MSTVEGVELRVLGPLLAIDDGGDVLTITSRQQRALLLALSVGHPGGLATDALVGVLWREPAPASAKKQVQNQVLRLRTRLGRDVIATTQLGYVLGDGVTVDAAAFESELGRARAEMSRGVPGASLPIFAAALARWRGRAYADVSAWPPAEAEAARLEELYHLGQEDEISARLACGEHRRCVAELETLVAEEPLREHRWAQLMVALYRSGRQGEALRAYQRARQVLARELGIAPSAELTGLEEAILRTGAEVEWPEARGASGGVTSGAGSLESVDSANRELERAPALAMPGALRGAGAGLLVGRDRDLDALMNVWKEARVGDHRAVVLDGEPGVGKTRLTAELARCACTDGALVMYGRCDEDLGITYQPWVEALRHAVARRPHVLADLPAQHAAALARFVPEMARFGGSTAAQLLEPGEGRTVLFDAVVRLVARLCRDEPVLLVLEDLHWADKPTLLLLSYLVGSGELSCLLVVATYRQTDLDPHHPLDDVLVALRREPRVQRFTLRGLEESAVAALLEAMVGHDLGESGTDLARAVQLETGGNPFFAAEIMRHLIETRAINQRDDGGWATEVDFRDPGSLPTSVQEVIERRVARLGEDVERTLRAAAAIGRDFDLELLSRVTQTTRDQTLDLLDAPLDAGLILETGARRGRFSFSHALVGHALYLPLGQARRERLHRSIALALEAVCGDDAGERVGELAYHWGEADPSAYGDKALQYAQRAGDQALSKFAPDDALVWYRAALRLVESEAHADDVARCQLLLSLGIAQRDAGDPGSQHTLRHSAEVARRLGSTPLLVRAALANNRGRVSQSGAVDQDRIDVLEAALAATRGAQTPERAMLLATLAAELTWGAPDRARMTSDEALALARGLTDDRALWEVLRRRAPTIFSPATIDELEANADEQDAVAQRLREPHFRFDAARKACDAAMCRGDLAASDRSLAMMREAAAECGLVSTRLQLALCNSWRSTLSGHLDEAETAADEAYQIARRAGEPDAFAYYAAQIARVRRAQGRLEEILELIERTAVEHARLVHNRPLFAVALCDAGRLDDARSIFEPLADAGFSDIPFNATWLSAMTFSAEVAAYLQHRAAAATLAGMLEPWRDQLAYNGVACDGSVERPLALALAIAGRLKEADDAFAQAAAMHQRIDAPIELARTQSDWARMRRSGSQADDLDQAKTVRAELGSPPPGTEVLRTSSGPRCRD